MIITRVEYRYLNSLPGYNNETVGATALVEECDSPDVVLDDLKQWVMQQLGRDAHATSRTKEAEERLREALASVLDTASRAINESVNDDIPF